MDHFPKKDLEEALQVIFSVLDRCKKAQLKLMEGTSQHTLLINRIKALSVSKSLIADENAMDSYTKAELAEALRSVSSIISKCEKAKQRFAEGTPYHTRMRNMIKAMSISKTLIINEISKRA